MDKVSDLDRSRFLLSDILEELKSPNPDYAWITKVMTKEKNIKMIAKVLSEKNND